MLSHEQPTVVAATGICGVVAADRVLSNEWNYINTDENGDGHTKRHRPRTDRPVNRSIARFEENSATTGA